MDVSVLVKTPSEIKNAIATNPFQQKKYDPSKSHVTFLSKRPKSKEASELQEGDWGEDMISISGDIAFIYCPNGYGRTKLTNNFLEKKLAVRATTRNWKTVNTLYEMSIED